MRSRNAACRRPISPWRAGTCCVLVVSALVLGATPRACAEDGDGLGVGPVIAYSNERSWSLGWELGVTRGGPLLKASLGGVYHFEAKGDDPWTVHYLAWEPWFIVGGTLGVAVADGKEVARVAYGLWEGFPLAVSAGDDPFPFTGSGDTGLVITFAIGWRGFGSMSQIYFAPKLWRYTTIRISS